MTEDSVNNLEFRDLNYLLQIDKILNTSLSTYKVKPRNIKSPFSEAMVKEYRDEANKPISITDAFGVRKEYKYHPATAEPVLDDYVPLAVIYDDAAIKADLQRFVDDINKILTYIDNLNIDIVTIRALVDSGTLSVPNRKKEMNNIRLLYEEIKKQKQFIIGLERDIATGEQLLEDNIPNKLLNQAEKSRIDALNRDKLNSFVNEMNLLNAGQFKVDQNPNETDDEYLDRLKETAQTPGNDYYTEVEAEIENIKKFKVNMKDLIRSDIEIEKVQHKLDTDDIFGINKIFSLIKERFLKLFGFDNKNVSTDEIVDFMLNMINQSSDQIAGATQPVMQLVKVPTMIAPGTQLTPSINIGNANNALTFNNDTTGFKLFLKLGTAKRDTFIMYSFDGNPGTFYNVFFGPVKTTSKEYDRSMIKLLLDIGLTKEEATKLFGKSPTRSNVEKFLEDNGITKEPTTTYTHVVPAGGGGKGQHVYGMGVEKLPQLCPFGKVLIRLDRLYYKNILSVLTHTKSNIAGFKPCPVSDEFVNIIMKLCNGNQPTLSDLKTLQLNEKELYDTLLYLSGSHKSVDIHTRDTSIEKLKEKLQVVEGEISSGNNNAKLLNELSDILNKLSHLGVITRAQANKHYKQIQTDYF
jgi:predicted site-specific integrase-resolvase